MRAYDLISVAVAFTTLAVSAPAQTSALSGPEANPHSAAAVAELVNGVSYGVPTSPAFALLPQQPSEVVHITTPADFQGNTTSWVDGARLKTGAAFDWRPLASMVGSLDEYRRSGARQVWWRTVLSAGTAPPADKSHDVLLAAGVRIPIVDRGDLRLDNGYIELLRNVLGNYLDSCTPLRADESTDDAARQCPARRKAALDSVAKVQDSVARANWNAFRFDVGFAAMARARNAYLRTDSITGSGGGVWVGLSHAFVREFPAQISEVLKVSIARTDSATQERARVVAGARVRSFPFGRAGQTMGVSVEAARIWSWHRMSEKDDAWVHLAAVLEVPLPAIGGLLKNQWLGIAYGGDAGHKDGSAAQLSLRYAIYANRLLK